MATNVACSDIRKDAAIDAPPGATQINLVDCRYFFSVSASGIRKASFMVSHWADFHVLRQKLKSCGGKWIAPGGYQPFHGSGQWRIRILIKRFLALFDLKLDFWICGHDWISQLVRTSNEIIARIDLIHDLIAIALAPIIRRDKSESSKRCKDDVRSTLNNVVHGESPVKFVQSVCLNCGIRRLHIE